MPQWRVRVVTVCRRWGAAVQRVSESRTNYWLSYLFDLATPLVLAFVGWRLSTSVLLALVALFAGVFAFSFVEYAIHRWLFHSRVALMTAAHQLHHDSPCRLTALPFVTGAFGTALWWLAIRPFAEPQVVCFFLCGLSGGYFWYGVMHHLQHNTSHHSLPARLFHKRWALHVVHHRLGNAHFGVTTSFWDHVFSTTYRARKRQLAL